MTILILGIVIAAITISVFQLKEHITEYYSPTNLLIFIGLGLLGAFGFFITLSSLVSLFSKSKKVNARI